LTQEDAMNSGDPWAHCHPCSRRPAPIRRPRFYTACQFFASTDYRPRHPEFAGGGSGAVRRMRLSRTARFAGGCHAAEKAPGRATRAHSSRRVRAGAADPKPRSSMKERRNWAPGSIPDLHGLMSPPRQKPPWARAGAVCGRPSMRRIADPAPGVPFVTVAARPGISCEPPPRARGSCLFNSAVAEGRRPFVALSPEHAFERTPSSMSDVVPTATAHAGHLWSDARACCTASSHQSPLYHGSGGAKRTGAPATSSTRRGVRAAVPPRPRNGLRDAIRSYWPAMEAFAAAGW